MKATVGGRQRDIGVNDDSGSNSSFGFVRIFENHSHRADNSGKGGGNDDGVSPHFIEFAFSREWEASGLERHVREMTRGGNRRRINRGK